MHSVFFLLETLELEVWRPARYLYIFQFNVLLASQNRGLFGIWVDLNFRRDGIREIGLEFS